MPERLGRRSLQLVVGLYLYGLGIALVVRSRLGSAPWDVLTQGIINHVPLSFGAVTVITSVAVLLLWIPLRQRPGLGSLVNALLVGPFADLSFLFLPELDALWLRIPLLGLGIVAVGAATGLYIGAGFGPGPRDGLMTGLHVVTGRPVWIVRTALEVTVVTIGWLLGGTVGPGTLAFALLIGPLCQFFLRVFAIPPSKDR
ncbi:YitT family protein [Leucobacter sp. wl10]|uniref:membrane protein YczE n=1 Tax=Leucobacter sp. wl10 TaxID=2304677 RepID=UPI000E5C472D|nr:hypothetical protein [Leucobacter sp. wl10]RGE21146.1 hypothetical protein D1J51_07225 [Leucobacter sp. wl10]